MKWVLYLAIITALISLGWGLNSLYNSRKTPLNPIAQIKPRPLDKYTIENISRRISTPSEIKIEQTLKDDKNYTSYLISFLTDGKKVTGQMNVPKGRGKFPLMLMIRGYVDQKIYETGIGTRKAASVFAENGFITLAPDFLGYAGSDKEVDDVFESRFQTYTTLLDLISSLKSIEEWDGRNIFLWGHSNGGQIALTVLEITGATYPTVLWAPLTKSFPYSILAYSDEASDSGKFLRSELAKFESTYDTDLYSLTNYLDRIKAPLEIHQGTGDMAVRPDWTDSFVKRLKKIDVEVDYFKYPGADHNLTPGWDTVVGRNLLFFKKHLIPLTK